MNIVRTLNIIARAWGNQDGYCFFPYIDREEQKRTGRRQAGYNEGPHRPKSDDRGPSFKWPEDKREIQSYLKSHLAKGHDVYWCPSLFEFPQRRTDYAMDEHCLWADLDEADPREMGDFEPTIAWESSPGRYQALWLATEGDFQGASWPGNENQRLTYFLGADPSGWDTTQLLRLPGWPNFKPERVEANGGTPLEGKLLWSTGPTYVNDDFKKLPEVKGAVSSEITEALEAEIDGVERLKVLAKLKIKLNHTARELIAAREVTGDRSGQMWYLMRCLADAGASVTEIVAIIRPSVWNKFSDRADEMKRLIAEASKAVASRSDEVVEELEEEEKFAEPILLGELTRNIKQPTWLVENIITEGAVGFIAGEPKTWKSWFGYDMALSIATGADFLGVFPVKLPGPVLYVQEEDPPPVLKIRGHKIWQGKQMDRIVMEEDHGLVWLPADKERQFEPKIAVYAQQGVTISDEAWQYRLDETLEKGILWQGKREPYRFMLIDTLMMTAGNVDENRAQEMTTKVFKPLKVLARKHNVAILVVHHLNKGDNKRMGQRMLGSVANHAWGEDSIYLLHGSRRGTVKLETESKSTTSSTWKIENLANAEWNPIVSPWSDRNDEAMNQIVHEPKANHGRSGRPYGSRGADRSSRNRKHWPEGDALERMGGIQTTRAIAAEMGREGDQQIGRHLAADPRVKKINRGLWAMKGTEE